jgi:endoglucanase
MMRIKLFMNFLLRMVFFLVVAQPSYCQDWPAWQAFKSTFISNDGRVIDLQSSNKITTSEGQSYALLFALIANDSKTFSLVLHWTEANLAKGDLKQHLPAWIWGQNKKMQWAILDANTAADADLWIAYSLLEAGRIWNNKTYTAYGKRLLQLIITHETAKIPGLGYMLMPGSKGFTHNHSWMLNPSYLPPQILTRVSKVDNIWNEININTLKLLIETSPKGYAPDWVCWVKNKGWQACSNTPNLGSYNAIRVYLWIGLMADSASKTTLVTHFQPMVTLTEHNGQPPERINTITGAVSGTSPEGFFAALLPLLSNTPHQTSLLQRVQSFDFKSGAYYDAVLTLFALGWLEHRYQFNAQGELIIPIYFISH